MNKEERKKLIEQAKIDEQEKVLSGIALYPKVKDVLEDKELECVFRPILTVKRVVEGKEFLIHILLCLGISGEPLEKNYLYSEGGFFGFDYNNGKYIYLGSKEVFWNYNKIKELYSYLTDDFIENRDVYLEKKITMEAYVEGIMKKVSELVIDDEYDNLTYYIESFYSYELVKYQYQSTGVIKSFNEITKAWTTSFDFIYDEEDIQNIMDEFFINLEYNLANSYDISENMACFGMAAYSFMRHKDMVFALTDANNDRVYMLEYFS